MIWLVKMTFYLGKAEQLMNATIAEATLLEPFNLLGIIWTITYIVFAVELANYHLKNYFFKVKVMHRISTWYLNHYFIYLVFVIAGLLFAYPQEIYDHSEGLMLTMLILILITRTFAEFNVGILTKTSGVWRKQPDTDVLLLRYMPRYNAIIRHRYEDYLHPGFDLHLLKKM